MPSSRKYRLTMPSRLNAFAANTTNVSRVIAKIAGIESIANMTSNAATMTSAAMSGVAAHWPRTFVIRRPPSYSRETGTTRRSARMASERSGSTSSPLWRAIFTAVTASRAPSTYVMKLNASSAAAPTTMNAVRSTIAPATPSSSTRWRSVAGTAKNVNSIANTNRLSSESDFSMRKPARYSSAAVRPAPVSRRTPAKPAPIAVHRTDQNRAERIEGAVCESARKSIARATRTNAPSAIQGSIEAPSSGGWSRRFGPPAEAGAPGPRAGVTTRRLAGLLPLRYLRYRQARRPPHGVATRSAPAATVPAHARSAPPRPRRRDLRRGLPRHASGSARARADRGDHRRLPAMPSTASSSPGGARRATSPAPTSRSCRAATSDNRRHAPVQPPHRRARDQPEQARRLPHPGPPAGPRARRVADGGHAVRAARGAGELPVPLRARRRGVADRARWGPDRPPSRGRRRARGRRRRLLPRRRRGRPQAHEPRLGTGADAHRLDAQHARGRGLPRQRQGRRVHAGRCRGRHRAPRGLRGVLGRGASVAQLPPHDLAGQPRGDRIQRDALRGRARRRDAPATSPAAASRSPATRRAARARRARRGSVRPAAEEFRAPWRAVAGTARTPYTVVVVPEIARPRTPAARAASASTRRRISGPTRRLAAGVGCMQQDYVACTPSREERGWRHATAGPTATCAASRTRSACPTGRATAGTRPPTTSS